MLITAVGRGGGDSALRDNSPVGGAGGWGAGEDDWMIKPEEGDGCLPRVVCSGRVLFNEGGGEALPGGGGGGGKAKNSSVGVVPK